MHSFLEAIGFQKLSENKIHKILKEIIEQPQYKEVAPDSNGNEFVIFSKSFGDHIGIAVCGRYVEKVFHMEYYYPYFLGKGKIAEKNIEIEKHADKESYAAVCDDIKVGVVLIFYLLNSSEYMKRRKVLELNKEEIISGMVTLCGLCLSGTILLPVEKSEKQKVNMQRMIQERSSLIAAAREGDEEAIENLTLEDIDMYSSLSKRINQEDILSIVDTYFMPYGIESDQYSVLGEILKYEEIKNTLTNEELVILTIDTNDLIYDICINKNDLLGIPEVGRRFKGNIWMQGTVSYNN